jgi:hypothetical protein
MILRWLELTHDGNHRAFIALCGKSFTLSPNNRKTKARRHLRLSRQLRMLKRKRQS